MKTLKDLHKAVKALKVYKQTEDVLADVPEASLKRWIGAELVHGDEAMARKIVADHVQEHGLGYYPAFLEFEKQYDEKITREFKQASPAEDGK